MAESKFRIVSGTDKEYIDAFDHMKAEGKFIYEKINLHPFGEVGSDGLAGKPEMRELVSQNLRIFESLTFSFGGDWFVRIQRQPDQNSTFDQVTVSPQHRPIGQKTYCGMLGC